MRSGIMRLLLVEDDPVLGDAMRAYLQAHGDVVDWVVRLAEARVAVMEGFDAILLDWNLPDGSGVQWLRVLRARPAINEATPVLLLTARDKLVDRIEGLDAGADDYLIKPFELSELAARVRAVTRRTAGHPHPLLQAGPVTLNPATREVRLAGQRVDCTAREFMLLEALMRRAGHIVSRSDLERLLYGYDGQVSSNAIEVHLSNLRRKLGRELVETLRGLGYRLKP
jgi:two-component system OmpR family response regulator